MPDMGRVQHNKTGYSDLDKHTIPHDNRLTAGLPGAPHMDDDDVPQKQHKKQHEGHFISTASAENQGHQAQHYMKGASAAAKHVKTVAESPVAGAVLFRKSSRVQDVRSLPLLSN
jgi:hypothetical protein